MHLFCLFQMFLEIIQYVIWSSWSSHAIGQWAYITIADFNWCRKDPKQVIYSWIANTWHCKCHHLHDWINFEVVLALNTLFTSTRFHYLWKIDYASHSNNEAWKTHDCKDCHMHRKHLLVHHESLVLIRVCKFLYFVQSYTKNSHWYHWKNQICWQIAQYEGISKTFILFRMAFVHFHKP